MSATHIIKKYPNRRLYDTEISSYVTIEDVRQLVIAGKNFEVHDARTGASLTRSVLLQVILDKEQGPTPVLSTQLLRQIIRFYDSSDCESLNHYLERSVQLFLEQQQPAIDKPPCRTQWSTMNQLAERNLASWSNAPASESSLTEEEEPMVSVEAAAPDDTRST